MMTHTMRGNPEESARGWFTLPHQDRSCRLVWQEMSNGKTFLNRATLNGDRVVRVDLNNRKWTDVDEG